MFFKVMFFGNGFVVIFVGLFGNLLVDILSFGFVLLFDVVFIFLVIGMVVMLLLWIENYGDFLESKDLFI